MSVAGGLGQMLEARGEREEFTQAVPSEVVFREQLLDVPGCRTTSPRLEHAAPRDQGDDREHLGTRAKLHDREQIREVVTQHVASNGDGALALADTLQTKPHGVPWRHD